MAGYITVYHRVITGHFSQSDQPFDPAEPGEKGDNIHWEKPSVPLFALLSMNILSSTDITEAIAQGSPTWCRPLPGELMIHPQGTLNPDCLLIHVTYQCIEVFPTHILCWGWHKYIWEPILAFLYLNSFFKIVGARIRPTWHTFILPIHGVEWWHLGLPLLLAWYGHNQGTLWYVGRTWKGHIGAYTKIKTLHISLGRKDWWIHFRKLICHSFGYRHSKAELTQIQVVHGSLCSYCVRVLPLTGPPPRSKQLTVTCLLLSVQMHLQVQLNSKFRGIRSHSRLCGQRSSEQSLFMTLRENSL